MERNVSAEQYRAWLRKLEISSQPAPQPARKPQGCPKECWPRFNKKRQHGQRSIRRYAG